MPVFWGFPVVASWTYQGSFYVHGSYNSNITVNLQSLQNRSWAEASVQVVSNSASWTQFKYTLCPTESAPDSNNTLVFTYASQGNSTLDFNLISLFPPTFNNRPNGLRIDLMEAMGELKPTFFRVPGGNNLEGTRSPYWWNWTQTIGPLEKRPGFPGAWSYENTNGLGLIEYMLWAKDLNMAPLLCVWAGLWLDGEVVPQDELQVYVQSALDELEFLMGDASTQWGAVRVQLGYSEPFEVKFVEVGNEDSLNGGGASYSAYRFHTFYDAISAAHPDITIIGSYYDIEGATPPEGASGDFHEYAVPVQMSSQFHYFDNYTSAHPILIGEYAVVAYDEAGLSAPTWEHGARRAFAPFWYGSVAEAIFLLGAERNSDKIIGAAYAPMFQNLNRWRWIPDLIQYDAFPGHTTMTTSWEMIRLLSNTLITENLPLVGAEFDPAYYVAGRNSVMGSHILKAAVYNATKDVLFSVHFEGVRAGATGDLTWLTAPVNGSNPVGGSVVERHVQVIRAEKGGRFSFRLPEYTVAVLEIKEQHAAGHSGRKGWKGSKTWKKERQDRG